MTGPVTQPVTSAPQPRTPVATGTAEWDRGPNSPRVVVTSLVLGGLILIPLLVRASVNFNPLPWWDMDPLTFVPGFTGLTPATSMLCDIVVMAASALALLRSGPNLLTLPAVLGAAVCTWVNIHTVADMRLGASWASGVMGAVALMVLCRTAAVRATLSAVVVGFVGLLAVKAGVQWMVEHPASVEAFKRDRALILASNGWEEGSAMARGYERRLMQQEASGWFGLANVLATFAAAGTVAFGLLVIGAIRTRSGAAAVVPGVLGLAAAGAILLMTGAKGAMAACAGGALAATVLAWLGSRAQIATDSTARTWARPAGLLALCVPIAVVGAVCLRGALGERLAELSVWFRWFYWQAAVEVGLAGGCGPGGFQEAYLLAKPPLSPEEVQSAHNAAFDWFAALGWPSAALVVVLAGLLWCAGRGAVEATPASDARATTGDWASGAITRAVLLTIALATLAALYLDRALMTEQVAVVRLGGMAAWMLIALGTAGVLRRGGPWPSCALAGAAIVLSAHGAFEVTGTNQQAGGVWWAMLGVAASGAGARRAFAPRLRGPGSIVAASLITLGLFACVSAAVLWMGVTTARRALRLQIMESHLHAAAEACRPASELRAWLTAASRSTSPADRDYSLRRAAEIAASLIPSGETAAAALPRAQLAAIPSALAELDKAYAAGATGAAKHSPWEVLRERSRLMLTAAGLCKIQGQTAEARTWAQAGVVEAQRAVIARPSATSQAWLATALQSAHGLVGNVAGVTAEELLDMSAQALRQAQTLDPYNPAHAHRLLKLAQQRGQTAELPALARDLLRLDELQRLDPAVRGLSPDERANVEALARQN